MTSAIRASIVDVAESVAELRAAVDPAAFRALIGDAAAWDLSVPFSCRRDPATGRYVTRGVSTCGLVAVGILRRAGVALPFVGPYWHWPRYEGLDVVSALSKLGVDAGARRAKGDRPEPGDVCCIGSALSTHVFIVTACDDTLRSIDGGQIDDAQHRYLQRVRACRRPWPRPLVWCIDAVQLYAYCEAMRVYP